MEISQAQVVTPNQSINYLSTFWNKSDIDLSRGLDFSPRGTLLARFTHLNHAPFTYRINVVNKNRTTLMGTCRIFLGPKFDERGLPFNFRAQKDLMMEMDKFTVTCKDFIQILGIQKF